MNEREGATAPFLLDLNNQMITVEQVKKLAEEKLAGTLNFIVDISVKPGNKITILLDNDAGISISDCVNMSRYVEQNLDREKEDFELNVMSPGLTEPFKTIRQYQKHINKQVEVVTRENQKLAGKLLSVSNEGVIIETRATKKIEKSKPKQLVINNITLTFNQIKETKVVISF